MNDTLANNNEGSDELLRSIRIHGWYSLSLGILVAVIAALSGAPEDVLLCIVLLILNSGHNDYCHYSTMKMMLGVLDAAEDGQK